MRTSRARKRKKSMNEQVARQSKFTKVVDGQSGLCWFCGERMGVDCTKEHWLAKARGGTDTHPLGNLKAAHSDCNSAAGDLTVEDKADLRQIGLTEGRSTMLMVAKQLRRAQARSAFE